MELELTETMLMENAGMPATVIADLSALGVMFSIDDFGTGYSNLGYLKRFPLHRLKIDQSFVRGISANHEDVAIIRAVLGLEKNLKLKVLAEGVETIEQLNFLRAEGCEEIQGYYVGRPMPAHDFEAILASKRPIVSLCRPHCVRTA